MLGVQRCDESYLVREIVYRRGLSSRPIAPARPLSLEGHHSTSPRIAPQPLAHASCMLSACDEKDRLCFGCFAVSDGHTRPLTSRTAPLLRLLASGLGHFCETDI
jgi:hypothetical protein